MLKYFWLHEMLRLFAFVVDSSCFNRL